MLKKLICTLLLLTVFVCGCGKSKPKNDLENILGYKEEDEFEDGKKTAEQVIDDK